MACVTQNFDLQGLADWISPQTTSLEKGEVEGPGGEGGLAMLYLCVCVCVCVILSPRAGKGVFSAMKLGKTRISKDDHKRAGERIIFCHFGGWVEWG